MYPSQRELSAKVFFHPVGYEIINHTESYPFTCEANFELLLFHQCPMVSTTLHKTEEFDSHTCQDSFPLPCCRKSYNKTNFLHNSQTNTQAAFFASDRFSEHFICISLHK